MRLIISAFTLAIIVATSAGAHSESPAVKVGFIGGFTGPASEYGVPCKNGFELAMSELGQNEGEQPIKVFFEDDQFLPAKTVAAYHKLIKVDKVDVLIVLGSTNGNAVAPLAQQDNIPTLIWAGDQRVAFKRPYIIQSWVSGQESGAFLAKEATQRGVQKAGFVIVEDDHPRSVLAGFQERFTGEVAEVSVVPPSHNEFGSTVAKLKTKGVTDVGLCLGPGQSALIARKGAELGANLALFGCETLDVPSEVEGKEEFEGTWFSAVRISKEFLAKYSEKFGEGSILGGAAVHYDIAKLLAEVSQRWGGDRAKLRSLMQSTVLSDSAVVSGQIVCAEDRCRLPIEIALKRVLGGRISEGGAK